MLNRTLDSLLAARVPQGLSVRVTVVDNNSKDRTRDTVESRMLDFGGRLDYLFEPSQGRSHALNAGIKATGGDLVGMIDDDEEIDPGWYARAASAFAEEQVDFIGGPYLPKWGAPRPAWLPRKYAGVIGWVDGGDRVVAYGEGYPGILMGGNAVIARAMLKRVGLYSTSLGRTDKRLLAGEDEDMYHRLLDAGARGLYLPDLIIYHYIPPERLTKHYFRRWCFWRGVSSAAMDTWRPASVAYLAGVPRYLYGEAARGLLRTVKFAVGPVKDPESGFSSELAFWDFAGFFYGKYFYRHG
jgi:glycosyltransferase involved in cell wall biosynthesis